MEKLRSLQISHPKLIIFGLSVFIILAGWWSWAKPFKSASKSSVQGLTTKNIDVPSIVDGELVLPKLVATDTSLTKNLNARGLRAVSVNLFAVPVEGQQKLAAIRVLGEMENIGTQVINSFSPVIKFYGPGGNILAQKIAHYSTGFEMFGLRQTDRSVYDVTVDEPPDAERLEIAFNVTSASSSALFNEMKIASRSMEIKMANYQGVATDSADQSFEYYTVSGSVVNTFDNPISEISIYGWAKNSEGKVYTFAKQDFKNDLLSPGDKVDFRITLLPFKPGETLETYEIKAWGKEYKLNF